MTGYIIDDIKIITESNVIKVINNRKTKLKIDFFNLRKNYAPYITTLNPGWWTKTNYNNWKEKYNKENEIIIGLLYDNITFLKYDKKLDKLSVLKNVVNFKKLSPPIIIHGNVGGGTSIVTKMLRYLGLFIGDDSGDFENRKTHESLFFRFVNSYIQHNNLKINEDGFKHFREVLYNSPNELYFGNKTAEDIDVWGFKHFFENNHLFFSDAFKGCKFLSVIKSQKNSINKTPQGLGFKNMDEFDVISNQFLKLEGNELFCVDYYKFFEDYNYVNKVLNFCNIKNRIENEEHFRMVLNEIKYEGKK